MARAIRRVVGLRPRLLVVLLILYYSFLGGAVNVETQFWPRVLHQIITTALLGVWLASLWRAGRPFPTTPLDWPLLAYGAISAAAAMNALDPRVSLEQAWPMLVHILGFYLLVDLMRRGGERWVFAGLFLAGAVMVLLSGLELSAWYFGLPPMFPQSWLGVGAGLIPPVLRRLEHATTNPNLEANFVALLIPAATAWALTTRQRGLRLALWALVGGLAAALLFTQSRGGWMSVGTSTATLAGFWLWRRAKTGGWRAWLPLGALILVVLIVAGFVFLQTFEGRDSGDLGRLDVWRSAVEMARDHPALGVGPGMYGAAVREYRDPELVLTLDRLNKAHNLVLHVAAELGLAGIAVMAWLATAFLRTWRARWLSGDAVERRRLEAGLAAFVGFGAHSMVDTFELTPMVLPLLIYAAYTVGVHAPFGCSAVPLQQIGRRNSGVRERWPVALAGALLIGYAAAFLPVNAAMFNLMRSAQDVDVGDLEAALETGAQAASIDPALDLYPAHVAYVLGRLAADDPGVYLDRAIAAHEHMLTIRPTFDLGYANLGALYAQRGDLPAAVEALERAVAIHPREPVYWLALGAYREATGDADGARAAYLRALEERPALSESGFWDEASGGSARAWALAASSLLPAAEVTPDQAGPLGAGRDDLAAGVYEEAVAWFDRAVEQGADQWLPYLYRAEAEAALARWDAAERDARMALFLAPGDAARAHYVLAQAAISRGDWETAERLLASAVPGRAVPQYFTVASYGKGFTYLTRFDYLPQLRAPGLGVQAYAPWLVLAARYANTGRLARAARIYRDIARLDPYLTPEMGARLAALGH